MKENGGRERFTTDQVLEFLMKDNHTNENAGRSQEAFDDYLGVILTDFEDNRSGAVQVASADSNDGNSSDSDGERNNAERRTQKITVCKVCKMYSILHNPTQNAQKLCCLWPNQKFSIIEA